MKIGTLVKHRTSNLNEYFIKYMCSRHSSNEVGSCLKRQKIVLAKTGKEAVNIAKGFDGDIDLAILDIMLPDLAGKEVYSDIMEARPNLKVIVCSGYAIDGPPQEILDAGAQDFIQKPFSYATLSEKLREVLKGK